MKRERGEGIETVAEALAGALQGAGITRVFGIPGGENVHVLDALRRVGLEFILVRNESSAVFMADVTARLTGKPGACLTTLGPGAANATAGLAHAFLDRAPVLVITAQIPDRLFPRQTHQYIDLQAVYAPIVKASYKLEPEAAREQVRQALKLTTSGRPGPVHIQVSNEDAREAALAVTVAMDGPESSSTLDRRAASALLQSRRPLIVAGLGLEPEHPYAELRRLAEAANAPVIMTPKAKGCLPDDHPLAGGTIGLTHEDPAYAILDESDCLLAIGFDVVELVKPWNPTAPLIWIAPWPNADPHLPAEAEFIGRMAPILSELATVQWQTAPEWGVPRVEKHRQSLAKATLPPPAPGRMLPQAVFRAMREAAPRDAILATDVGSHKILAALEWPAFVPNSFLVSNGLSCMSFGLPAAIAASLVFPERTVLCATGDAGLAMVMGELASLTDREAPVIVVVFNDGALDLIRSQQRRAGKPVFGTEFANPDFTAIAQAYGVDSCRVLNESQCAEAISTAVHRGKPLLVEAMIDPGSYPTTPASQPPM